MSAITWWMTVLMVFGGLYLASALFAAFLFIAASVRDWRDRRGKW